MSNKNYSNARKYIISWHSGDYSDMMNSLEECERHIAEVIEDSPRDTTDILVYEVSASYEVKAKGVQLTKRSVID